MIVDSHVNRPTYGHMSCQPSLSTFVESLQLVRDCWLDVQKDGRGTMKR